MSPIRDRRSDVLVGRDTELARARAVLCTRYEHSQTLFITGPAGIGKTALAEAALEGLDAEILYMRGTPIDRRGPYETAMNNVETFEQAERFQPALERIGEIMAWAYTKWPDPVESAREVVTAMRAIPRAKRACVVVWEDLHLFDEYFLQSAAYFARHNHLYDQPYLMLGRSGHAYPNFEGVPQLRLGPLTDDAAHQALSAWSGVVVPQRLAGSVNRRCDGTPVLLREVAADLAPAQLRGDVALPAPLPASPIVLGSLSDVWDSLPPETEHALAAFCLEPELPAPVAREVIGSEASSALMERGLLSATTGAVRLTRAALGWAAWQRLSLSCRQTVAERLAAAWQRTDALVAAQYRMLPGQLSDTDLTAARDALLTSQAGAAAEVRETVAEWCCRAAPDLEVRDGLHWLDACLDAEHLGAAVEAWALVSKRSPAPGDLLGLARRRAVLAGLTGDWVLGLTGPRELEQLASLPPSDAFVGWTLAARSAILAGAVHQARRYLDAARSLSQSAHPPGRTLWRLVDCEWHIAVGRSIPVDAYLEALTRWCDHGGGQHWYDDAVAAIRLTDLADTAVARQFLTSVETVHRDAVGMARVLLLGCQLHLDLVQVRIGAAMRTADELSRHTITASLHAPELVADLIRLHALTDWSGTAYTVVADQMSSLTGEPVIAAASGYAALVDGNYLGAVPLLRSALTAESSIPADRWEQLADLVECQVAAGDRVGAATTFAAADLPTPRSPSATAAAARAQALTVPSFDLRKAFEQALDVSDAARNLVHRARCQLAYARRLGQHGFGAEADRCRAEAVELFGHLGLPGWQRHATELASVITSGSAPTMLDQPLSSVEQQLLRLLLEGRRNKEMADALYVSLRTVEKMLTRLYRHYEVGSKAELVTKLRDLG